MDDQRQSFRLTIREQILRQHWILIHGTVLIHGKFGEIRFPYAWLEDTSGNIVWNVESKEVLLRESFYDLGQVCETTKYRINEALFEMRYNRHCGPWTPNLLNYFSNQRTILL